MEVKFTKEMLRIVREVQAAEPERQIEVIVTVEPGTDLSILKREGLKIIWPVETVNAVSGTITAENARKLAELPQVKKIEYDSEIRAF